MDHLAHALELLATRGPATAYAYMREHDLTIFPFDFVQRIEESILAIYERQREQKLNVQHEE